MQHIFDFATVLKHSADFVFRWTIFVLDFYFLSSSFVPFAFFAHSFWVKCHDGKAKSVSASNNQKWWQQQIEILWCAKSTLVFASPFSMEAEPARSYRLVYSAIGQQTCAWHPSYQSATHQCSGVVVFSSPYEQRHIASHSWLTICWLEQCRAHTLTHAARIQCWSGFVWYRCVDSVQCLRSTPIFYYYSWWVLSLSRRLSRTLDSHWTICMHWIAFSFNMDDFQRFPLCWQNGAMQWICPKTSEKFAQRTLLNRKAHKPYHHCRRDAKKKKTTTTLTNIYMERWV